MPNYIEILNLEAHEEGGYFRQVYKSPDKVIPVSERYHDVKQTRSSGTLIYFLLEKKRFSAWHRLKSDEVWHYYDGGSPIDIHIIDQNGKLITHTLGNPNYTENASFQINIDAGCWFAAEVRDKTSFGLAGCTVSPGFEYEDFELAVEQTDLPSQYPELEVFINKFLISSTKVIDTPNSLASNSHAPKKPKLNANDYIKLLGLERHIEGGYFANFYRSKDKVIPLEDRYKSNTEEKAEEQRCAGSSIYFLLKKHDFSAWHRLKSDEIWHYYDGGSPIDIHVIDTSGQIITYTLGNPALSQNAQFQVIIPAGAWFAAEVKDKSSFALVGCTVSPGFEYKDFELACRRTLSAHYPEHVTLINKFSRKEEYSASWTSQAIKYSTLALVAGIGFYAMFNGKNLVKNCINNARLKLGM